MFRKTLLSCILLCASLPWSVHADDPVPLRHYKLSLKAFSKNAKSDNEAIRNAAVYNLCELHWMIVTDERFQSSTALQSYRVATKNRLETFCRKLKQKKSREARAAKKAAIAQRKLERQASTKAPLKDPQKNDVKPAVVLSSTNASTAKTTLLIGRHLAPNQSSDSTDKKLQRGDNANSGSGNSTSNYPSAPTKESDDLNKITNPWLPSSASDLDKACWEAMRATSSTSNALAGGPSQIFQYAGGRFAPPWDHGPELVALIEQTIRPEFWRAGGGNGIIQYYQPNRVLVIGATNQIHDDVYGLLLQLGARGGF